MKRDGNGSGGVLVPFVWRPPRPPLERERRLAERWLWGTIFDCGGTRYGRDADDSGDLWEVSVSAVTLTILPSYESRDTFDLRTGVDP